MTKRAAFDVIVEGNSIAAILTPLLTSLSVSDKAGTHSDTASIALDDTGGRIVLPKIGAKITILLGWQGEGIRPVFEGTVDEIRSSGSRGGGRTISITAKGLDTTGKAKEPQHRNFDNMTVSDLLAKAGEHAGIKVRVDPALAGVVREYVEMRDESFAHLGERIAREIGGNFAIRGDEAIVSLRAAPYAAFIRAEWGRNLHGWDITPDMGRPAFGAVGSRWYDMAAATWRTVVKDTPLDAVAGYWGRFTKPGEAEARDQTDSDAATTERDATEGSVTIEGDTGAIPDGLCVVVGTRPGVDGRYRIEAATHQLSRGGGFVTKLDLKRAIEAAEKDRPAETPAEPDEGDDDGQEGGDDDPEGET
ncbi:MAG: hypothetical protein LC676_10615 [Loktanella sp.]|nr:hypothetical protein [Loktanella sp.]